MNKKNPLLNVGWSLMLLMFASLLLTTFSVLSVVTSKSQLDLSKKFSDAQTAYYEGNSKANEILRNIDEVLFEVQKESTPSNYNKNAYDELKNKENILVTYEKGICKIEFSVPCDNKINEIKATISLENCGEKNEQRYKILSFKFVNTTEDEEVYIEDDVEWWGA